VSRSAPAAWIAASLLALSTALSLVRNAAAAPVPTDTTAFTLFGWLSPPPESTTADRVGEMAGLSFNLTLPAQHDAGRVADNLQRLDWARDHGMRCLIWDDRMNGAWHWLPTFEDTLDQIVADYKDHPAFWGYYLGDEPPSWEWPLLQRLRAALRARDPVHPAWNNLIGRVMYPSRAAYEDTLSEYAGLFDPVVLSSDQYDFTVTGDRNQFVENIVALRTVADSRAIPFWAIVQLIPHSIYRPLDPGELRWQVSELLAYGARGVGYFTYWPPDPDPAIQWGKTIIGNDGRPTDWYGTIREFNVGVRAAGEALARSRWKRTTHSGSVPPSGVAFTPDDWIADVDGRAAIGEFDGPGNERYVLIANSDSLAARTIRLRFQSSVGARALVLAPGQPPPSVETSGGATWLSLSLDAGGFALMSLTAPGGAASALAVMPNPASGVVSFAVQATGSNARVEVLDANGRRIWSRTVAGPATLFWRGELDAGGTAKPGVYFARVTGASPSGATRFTWMGAK
jgi:hypothetical protein